MWRRTTPLLSRVCAQAVATTAGETTARCLPSAIDATFSSVPGAATPASRLFSSWHSGLQQGHQSSSSGGAKPGEGWGLSTFPGARSYSGASGALPSDSDESDFPAGGDSLLDSSPLGGGLDVEAISAVVGAAELDALLQATEEAWYPTIGLQKLMETIHERGELPWWASIMATTLVVRGATFPVMVSQMKNTARMSAARPEMEALVAWFKEEQMRGNGTAAQKEYQERIHGLWQKHDCNPMKSLVSLLVQAPVFICFFGALRHMAAAHVPSMTDGGLFWFTDLTVADPTYALPVLTSLSFLATVELGAADGMQGQSADMLGKMKMFMRGLSVVMVPVSASLPAGVFIYWITSNFFSMAQTLFLRLPGMKARLGLPVHKPTSTGTATAAASTSAMPMTFAQKPAHQPEMQLLSQPPQQLQPRVAPAHEVAAAAGRSAKKGAGKAAGRKRRR